MCWSFPGLGTTIGDWAWTPNSARRKPAPNNPPVGAGLAAATISPGDRTGHGGSNRAGGYGPLSDLGEVGQRGRAVLEASYCPRRGPDQPTATWTVIAKRGCGLAPARLTARGLPGRSVRRPPGGEMALSLRLVGNGSRCCPGPSCLAARPRGCAALAIRCSALAQAIRAPWR